MTQPDMVPESSPHRNLLRAVVTDIHFWIPVCVLIAGLALLDKLR